MRYIQTIKSDSGTETETYSVLCQLSEGRVQALACTCPDDEFRGHERPCKHRVRAELVPDFVKGRRTLILSGRITGKTESVVTRESLDRFAELFREAVKARESRGMRPADAVTDAVRSVAKAARQ